MTGRKPLPINAQELEKLCTLQCTDEEIAHWFGCSKKTIQRLRKKAEYQEAFERGAAKGRVSLKRAQYQAAMDGNVTMLIWLGKNYLAQKDTVTNEHTGANGGPIETHVLTDTERTLRLNALLEKANKRRNQEKPVSEKAMIPVTISE